jgi:predicted phage terminase large subunit-like protein
MSYSDELVLGFSRTVKGIISSPEFAEIFPLFKLYNGKPFEVERESDWKIKNANVPKSNHIARTRNGSTTGERASFAIIFDDMTKGAEEANSEKAHRDIYDKWNTEWWNRRDGVRCKFIFVGTQWCNEDILNRIIEDRNKVSRLKNTDNPYVMESEDKSTIVIRVPMLDENHKTTCSEVYPQQIAEQIEQNTDPFLFSCVYQQDPLPVSGREFAWENLRTYLNLPSDLESYCMASLDTARKGKDNVSMPIFKPDGNGNYYFVDCIFKQKPMEDLYDEIIEKIIQHRIIKLVIENNIDTSLKTLLTDRLKQRGVNWCEIIEKYNTVKKEERIKNNRGIVQKFVVFLDKTLTKPNSDYGRLMENMTKYSFDKPNLHDDSVDSVCMFASEIIVGKFNFIKPIACKRLF